MADLSGFCDFFCGVLFGGLGEIGVLCDLRVQSGDASPLYVWWGFTCGECCAAQSLGVEI